MLRAVAERVAELDLADLIAVGTDTDRGTAAAASKLARTVMRSATGPRAIRTKARYELLLQATRDPDLAEAFRQNSERFATLHREIVVRLQPAGESADADLVDEQTFATISFINGVMIGFAMGNRTVESAEQLDRMLSGIVSGIAATSSRTPSR